MGRLRRNREQASCQDGDKERWKERTSPAVPERDCVGFLTTPKPHKVARLKVNLEERFAYQKTQATGRSAFSPCQKSPHLTLCSNKISVGDPENCFSCVPWETKMQKIPSPCHD